MSESRTPSRTPWSPQAFGFAFAGGDEDAAAARALCRERLGALPTRVVDDTLLVVTELIANVRMHTAERAGELRVTLRADGLRIAVSDRSDVPPLTRFDQRPGGHGLRIIAALVRRWGVDRDATGKTVWAELAIDEPTDPTFGGTT